MHHYTDPPKQKRVKTEKQRARDRERALAVRASKPKTPRVTIGDVDDIVVDDARLSQAERVIRKFGGARPLTRAINELEDGTTITPATVYRWTYPRARGGTDGIIPTSEIPVILKAAKRAGIFLSDEDLFPGVK